MDGSVPSWGTDYRSRKRIASPRWTYTSSGTATGAARSSTSTGSTVDRRLDVSGATTWSVLLPDAGSAFARRRRTHRAMFCSGARRCRWRGVACGAWAPSTRRLDRRQRRRRGGGLGRRLPRPTEPLRLRPVRGWGEQQQQRQQGSRVRIPVVTLFFLSL